MKRFLPARGIALVAAVSLAVALSACARSPNDADAFESAAGGNGAAGGYGAAGGPGSLQEFAAKVGDRVFFDTDSTELNAAAQQTLTRQAEWLNRYSNYTFTLEGHADERGTREYNFALGARRAEVSKEYLVSKGVSASRMKTISYGKERPVATCNDISCWSQNRRAVTVLAGAAGSS